MNGRWDRHPEIVRLSRVGGVDVDLAVVDLDAGSSNNNETLFVYADGDWTYHLSTRTLQTGTYVITIRMPDGKRYDATFGLR